MQQIFLGSSGNYLPIVHRITAMSKINLDKLKTIIREEMKVLKEGEDHQNAVDMADASAKLLKAVEAFNDAASEKLKAEVEGGLAALTKTLERVVSSPMNYVDKVNKPVIKKKVSFKPDKGGLL